MCPKDNIWTFSFIQVHKFLPNIDLNVEKFSLPEARASLPRCKPNLRSFPFLGPTIDLPKRRPTVYGLVQGHGTRPYSVCSLHGESMVGTRKGKDPRFGLQRGRLALAADWLIFSAFKSILGGKLWTWMKLKVQILSFGHFIILSFFEKLY